MSGVAETLAKRGAEYGAFLEQARIANDMKLVMGLGQNWQRLEPDQREALDMIAVKIARILNGNPDNHDSWIDIAGYATLVADRLAGK